MKKFIVAILTLLYMSSSMGATIHLHYCMGKMINWDLWHAKEDKCGKCGMKKTHIAGKKSCCRDEHKHLKIEKDQKLSESFSQFNKTFSEATPLCIIAYSISIPRLSEKEYPKTNAPPLSSYTPIYIRNCVFRI